MPVLLRLYLLNMPWYTLRAQRVEQVGRSLLEQRVQVSHFGLHLNYAGLSFRTRRGKSEHYRAASPLTAGRAKISDFRFEISDFGRRQVQQKTNQPFAISDLRSQNGDG
jgi:hypothetical protein